MLWVLVDVALGLVAVALMVVLALRLWRRVRTLTRAVGTAGRAIAVAQEPAQEPAQGPARDLPGRSPRH